MAKSRNTILREQREARERAHLAAHGGDRIAASLAGHEERLARAVAAKDYSSMRDAQKVVAELRAIVNARPAKAGAS